MPPVWLTALAWAALAVAFASAAWIGLGHLRSRLPPAHEDHGSGLAGNCLVFRPAGGLGLPGLGRPATHRWRAGRGDTPDKPGYATTAVGVSHCGAGCALGDIIAEFAVFGLGASVAGFTLGAEYIGDYLAAIALGIVFQYFAIAPMWGMSLRKGLIGAAKADVASLTAFEIGLFGWMALMFFVFFPAPHLHPDSAVYWFLMQIGMVAGFLTAWPVNTWLIRRGSKEAM